MEGAIISFLVNKVGEQLITEAIFLSGVSGQVRSLEGELKQLHHFLAKANRNREKEDDVKEWLKRLWQSAYAVEDTLDGFIFRNERRGYRTSRFRRSLLFLRDIPSRRRAGKSITAFKTQLSDLFRDREMYGIQVESSIDNRGVNRNRALKDRKQRDNRPEMDGVIVGFEDQERGVVQRLISQGDELRVVSIFGMGGLGKTTLAKKVYGNREVQTLFDCIVWVSVSQGCSEDQLLRDLIKKIDVAEDDSSLEGLGLTALEDRLNATLKAKQRFLIIIDDVWEPKLWTGVKPAFRDISNGSRVLLTTRQYEVGKEADPSREPFQLRYLNEAESWELFNWKVFNTKDGCPRDLELTGHELVDRCKKLPLAIVILGGLLSLKAKTMLEWRRVLNTLDWKFDRNTEDCGVVLALSYHDMPNYLKPCFLYFGLFPEDAEIRSSKLKMLWIAEGFTEGAHDKISEKMSAEEIAEEYLEELYQRSLIQVVAKKSYGGSKTCGIKSCRIHDLLRDLAIDEAKDFEFLTVHGNQSSSKSPPKAYRRLAIQCHVDENDLKIKETSPNLRSLLCFNQRDLNLKPIVVNGLKLIRVMDLKDARLGQELPVEIGTLIYLRFLGLNNTGLKSLPSSVGDLFNLLALDIRSNGQLTVPPSVWKLKKLRHFYLDWHAPNKIEDFQNIQTLNGIPAGEWIGASLSKLTSLTRLVITKILRSHEDELATALTQLNSLSYLGLVGVGTSSIPITNLKLGNHNDLFLLTLYGKLEKLPDISGFPTNLMKLTLRASRLDKDPLPILGQLQSLESLKLLKHSYLGKALVCGPSSFPKLKFFTVDELDHLEDWEMEDGAMTNLRRLVISTCKKLKMLPEGLKHAGELHDLELVGMPPAFRNRVHKNHGEDLHKIQRSISISLIIR